MSQYQVRADSHADSKEPVTGICSACILEAHISYSSPCCDRSDSESSTRKGGAILAQFKGTLSLVGKERSFTYHSKSESRGWNSSLRP